MDANDRHSTASGAGAGTSTATTEPGPGPVHPAGHSGAGGDGATPHVASTEAAVRGLRALVAEALEHVGYLVSAKLDGYKIVARNVGIYAALGVIGLLAAASVVVTAVVLLLVGASMGIGALLGNRLWAGALIVSVVVLGGIAVTVIFGMKWLTKTSRAGLVRKYEERQRQQRERFGRDVRGRQAD